jgi:hypothetical protein
MGTAVDRHGQSPRSRLNWARREAAAARVALGKVPGWLYDNY